MEKFQVFFRMMSFLIYDLQLAETSSRLLRHKLNK